MINKIMKLGYSVLDKEKYYDEDTTIIEKNSILLKSQMITPRSHQNKDGSYLLDRRAIILNFNLDAKKIEIKLSEKDCYEKNIEYFSAFSPNTPNGAKIFFSSNNLTKILENVFENQLTYINQYDVRKNFLNSIISEDYMKFLKFMSKVFYNEPARNDKNKISSEAKIDVLNKKYFESYDDELKIIENINKFFFNKEKDLDKLPTIGKNCNNIFMITLNNQTIEEYEKGKFFQSYSNLCLYDFFDRFYIEEGIPGTKNICHNCGEFGKLTKNSVVPLKFIVPLTLCSENLKEKYAYNSFSICRNCLIQLLVGIKTLENDLDIKMFGLDSYLIPYQSENESLDYYMYKQVMNLFKNNNQTHYTLLEELSKKLSRANKRNQQFDIMFYYHNKQQFDILKLVSNIEASSIIKKFKVIDKYSKEYELQEIEISDEKKTYIGNNSLTFSTLRLLLIKSKYSTKSKLEFKNYGKKLIDLFDKFTTNRKFSELTLIKDFITIYKGRLINDKVDKLSALKMVLFLSIFDELGILKHGGNMENNELITAVQDKKIVEFLEKHNSVYKNNPHKQGLFLLGTIISKIKYAQKDKSSNILKRINFEGINSRKIQSLLQIIQDLYQIYKKEIFLHETLWGCIYDRLQEIENSKLTSEEIAFYILTGVAYQDYLGIIAGIDKKNKTNQGDQNENN